MCQMADRAIRCAGWRARHVLYLLASNFRAVKERGPQCGGSIRAYIFWDTQMSVHTMVVNTIVPQQYKDHDVPQMK